MRDTKQDAPAGSGAAFEQPAPATTVTDPESRVSSGLQAGAGETDLDESAGTRPVSADMQQFIGRQLRAVFDDVAKQPIPDRFLELMKQLDGKTAAG